MIELANFLSSSGVLHMLPKAGVYENQVPYILKILFEWAIHDKAMEFVLLYLQRNPKQQKTLRGIYEGCIWTWAENSPNLACFN